MSLVLEDHFKKNENKQKTMQKRILMSNILHNEQSEHSI